jgi:hypothetical protein
VLVFFPLYNVNSLATVRERLRVMTHERRLIAIMAAVGVIVVLPQVLIYYQATGHVFVSSYGDLGFNFGSPRLIGVLLLFSDTTWQQYSGVFLRWR